MTTLTAAPVSADTHPSTTWVRPWYPAARVGHIFADCPKLLAVVADPTPGAGWLDPAGPLVCQSCLERHIPSWDATCSTCDSSMAEEWPEDHPFTKADAERWKRDHECPPIVALVAPPGTAAPVPAGQTSLFDLKDAAA